MPGIRVGDLVVYNSSGEAKILPYRPSWMKEPMIVDEIDFTNGNDEAVVTLVCRTDPTKRGEELEKYLRHF